MAREQGFVPLVGGGVRHLGSLINSSDNYTAAKAVRQAGNARIQGSGGNQIKRIMTRIWDSRLLDDYDFRFYFTVHDEVLFSVNRDQVIPTFREIHGYMTEPFIGDIPSVSSIGLGRNYGQLIEIGETFDESKLTAAIETLFV